MMMLQTSSSGSGGSGTGPGGVSISGVKSRFLGMPSTTATFNDSQYVQLLKGLLRQELAGICCYQKFIHSTYITTLEFADQHKVASQQIERLILANRGIPADRAASAASSFSRAILEVCRAIPGDGPRKLVASQFASFELQLLTRYMEILKDAPVGDAEVLRLFKSRCERRLATLQSIF